MRINEVSESGFYHALMAGPKMIRASVSNSYWDVVSIIIIPEGQTQYINGRTLGHGKWLCRLGSTNWHRVETYSCIAVEPIAYPDKEKYFMELLA